VPGMNLTRNEARSRAAVLSVHGYDVALDLTTGEQTFASRTAVRFSCSEPGATTSIDLVAPSVTSVVLNGRSLDPGTAFDGFSIQLEQLQGDNELEVVADCAYMHTGEGLHRFVDPVDKAVYLYTQFEVADARRMFACFDQPDLKATFAFAVTAPEDWQVVSNAPTPQPEPVAGRTGVAQWRFAAGQRMSTYVTALVAGPYHVVRDEHRGIDLGLYCRASLAEHLDSAELFDVTKKGFDYFLELFDYPYPFDKYDQLFVPEFNAGAMENAGCVTILEDYVFRSRVTDARYERRAETVLHEMAHMWFGDLVTMRWWDDLWLNESFASYVSVLCQSEATRWTEAWTTFANVEKTWAYRQDQLPSTHPVAADIKDLEDVEVNFDGITYAKGASVLKQLVAWVGRDAFVEGVRRYFRRHEWGNTSLGDLLGALEETSGRDLSAWSREWLQTAGVNTLRPELAVDDEGRFTSFAVLQEAPPDWPTLRSHRVAVGLYDRTDAGLVRRSRVELDVTGARTEVPELVGELQPDLVLVNDDDLAYAKTRLDPRSLQTLLTSIGSFTEALPRAVCWAAAWDMTRDAELPARDYLDLVLSGIDGESQIFVVQALHRQVVAGLQQFADPAFREEGLRRWARAAYERVRATPPGSDQQLAWVRAFADVAGGQDELDALRRMLDGDDVIDGLSVDTELRWQLLSRLVAMGVAGEDDIETELRRDDTATGRRHAAAALAARPDADAKEEAWRSVVERDDLPNATSAAIIGGFVQREQRDLLEPYVERYFAALKTVWAAKTNEIAQQVVIGLYPALRVEVSTLERTDSYVAADSPVPALRRLLVEGRDGIARALRAQERDRIAGGRGTASVADDLAS